MAPWRIIKTQSGGIGSLMILQSTSTGVAGTIRCRDTAWIEHDFDVMTGVTIPFWATLPICPSPGVRTAMNSLYTTNTGITENTLADLDYMSWVLAIPGLSPTKIARIRNEFAVTEPTTLTERDAICPDWGLSDVRIFWRSLLHTHIGSCQRADLLAVASFSGIDTYPARARFFMNSWITLTPFNNSVYGTDLQWIKLTSIGDSLQYEKNEFWDLQWKTFYIVLNDNPPATPRYIFDAWNCAVRTTDSWDHWTIWAGACTINKISDRAVKITLTSNPSSSVLYFWNYSTLTKPIWTKIKAITLIQ